MKKAERNSIEIDTKTSEIDEEIPEVKPFDKKNVDKTRAPSNGFEEDFDSELLEKDFFSKFTQKIPYSIKEDEIILNYVLKGENITRVGSILLWKHLEAKKDNPKRTYQSLKNRFLRNIKPYLFTTYRYLIKDKKTVDKVLAKFPELKKQMGFKDTLISVNHSAGKPALTVQTKMNLPSVDANDLQGNIEGAWHWPDDDVPSKMAFPNPNSLNRVKVQRKVKLKKKSIIVTLNSDNLKCSENPSSPALMISERFKKLAAKTERVLCSACGRYSRRSKVDEFWESDAESDVLISDSVEMVAPLKNLKRKNVISHLESNNQGTNSKTCNLLPESSNKGLVSQALLTYSNETHVSDVNFSSENDCQIIESTNATDVKKAATAECSSKAAQALTPGISKKPTDLEAKEHGGDTNLDRMYETEMAKFRKLIDADEEKILLKKSLYKNRVSIGLNPDSEKNVDSYFLESSPESETPTLTDHFTLIPQNDGNKTPFFTASSALALNMIKMMMEENPKK